MQTVMDAYLNIITVGEGRSFGSMTLFPLFSTSTSRLRYRVLSEALADGSVVVTEKSSAEVPELYLVNRSDSMVLVLDGEEVVGGRQNRIVNASFLIGTHSEVPLPVTCVEHGRWHDVSVAFSAGEAMPASLRRDKEAQVHRGLRQMGRHIADQGAVWNLVAMMQAAVPAPSPTGAMNDVYRGKSADLSAHERAFPFVENAVGMAVALGGRMSGADLFDQSATAARLWNKLVRSYAMVAFGASYPPVERHRGERLLRRLAGATMESYPTVGVGRDVRLSGDGARGSALLYEGTVVHLGIFRDPGEARETGSGGMAGASTRRRLYFH